MTALALLPDTEQILSCTVHEDDAGPYGVVTVVYAINGIPGECVVYLPIDRDIRVVHLRGPRVAEYDEWICDAANAAWEAVA